MHRKQVFFKAVVPSREKTDLWDSTECNNKIGIKVEHVMTFRAKHLYTD